MDQFAQEMAIKVHLRDLPTDTIVNDSQGNVLKPTKENPIYELCLEDDYGNGGTRSPAVIRSRSQFTLFAEDAQMDLGRDFILPVLNPKESGSAAVLQRYLQRLYDWFSLELDAWPAWFEFTCKADGYFAREAAQRKSTIASLTQRIAHGVWPFRTKSSEAMLQDPAIPALYAFKEAGFEELLEVDCSTAYAGILAQEEALEKSKKSLQKYLQAVASDARLLAGPFASRLDDLSNQRPCMANFIKDVDGEPATAAVTREDDDDQPFIEAASNSMPSKPSGLDKIKKAQASFEVFADELGEMLARKELVQLEFIERVKASFIAPLSEHLLDFTNVKVRAFILCDACRGS